MDQHHNENITICNHLMVKLTISDVYITVIVGFGERTDGGLTMASMETETAQHGDSLRHRTWGGKNRNMKAYIAYMLYHAMMLLYVMIWCYDICMCLPSNVVFFVHFSLQTNGIFDRWTVHVAVPEAPSKSSKHALLEGVSKYIL